MSDSPPMHIPLAVGRADLTRARLVRPDGSSEGLTEAECALLAFFHAHAAEDLPRERIQAEVLGHAEQNLTRAVDSAVFRLRSKIEPDAAAPTQLITVQGIGYRWVPARASARPRRLPALRDTLVGRAAELSVLDEGGRLTTLTGPPGVGKTTLALAWAHRRTDRFPGGAWFAPLAHARTAADCVQGVATALDLPVSGSTAGAAERVGDALIGRGEGLLVLDNLEQVADVAAGLVDDWARRAPDLRIVVTSRRPLEVAGEHVVQLGSLDPEDARSLFVQRAEAVRGPWELDADEERDLSALCDALDGLPLALELAAARSAAMPVRAIRERLDRRLGLLSGARRGTPTLREAIAWSWDLLDPPEQAVFAQCAAFVGPFTMEGADTVVRLHGDGSVQEVLERLVARSLVSRVQTADGERLWLYRSLLAFAVEQLGQRADCSAVHERHARWLVQRWECRRDAVLGPDVVRVMRALRSELPDLLAVVDRWVDEDFELSVRALVVATPGIVQLGHLGVDERAERALARVGELPPALQSDLLGIVSVALRGQGRTVEARAWLQRALELPTGPAHQAARLSDLANLAVIEHELEEAEALDRRALALYDRLDPHPRRAVVLGDLAVAVKLQGRLDEARTLYEESLALHEQSGNALSLGLVVGNLAILHAEAGRLKEARALFERAVTLHARVHNDRSRAVALGNLGQLADEQGDREAAERFLRQALGILEETTSNRQETLMRSNLGALLTNTGRLAEARDELLRAMTLSRRGGNQRDRGVVHTELAVNEWFAGNAAAARVELDEARRALDMRPSPRDVARVDLWTAVMETDESEAEAALARVRQWSDTRDPSMAMAAVLVVGLRATNRGDHQQGARVLAAAGAVVGSAALRMATLLERALTQE